MRIATCQHCQQTTWVNLCTIPGEEGEYCANCFEKLQLDRFTYVHKQRTGNQDSQDTDPTWDNISKAYEDG